jgi:hypothetical protein
MVINPNRSTLEILAWPAIWVIAMGVALVGAHHVLAHGIWLDESYSMSFAMASQHDFIDALHRIDGPIAVYYSVLRYWLHLYPGAPTVEHARMLSVFFAILCIPAIFLLGEEIHSRKVGIVAALVIAFNPSFWHRAEDIRVYSMALFFSISAFYVFSKFAFTWRHPNSWISALLCGILNTIVFSLQVVIGGTTFVSELLSIPLLKFKPIWRELALTFLITCVGFAGFLGALTYFHGGSAESSWIPPIRSLKFLTGSVAQLYGTKLIIAVFALCVMAALWYNRGNRKIYTVLVWALAPIIVVELVSFVKPLFVERYLLSSLAPMIILVAIGITSFKRPATFGILAFVLLVEAYGTYHVDKASHEDWSLVTPFIESAPQKGDIIDVFPGDGSIGLITQLQLTNAHEPEGTYLFPSVAPTLWAHQWTRNNEPDDIPPAYYVGHQHAVWVVVRLPEYWPPATPLQAIVGLKQCYADTSKAIHIYKFAASCP